MGRISENNPRFRERDEMVADCVVALNSKLSTAAKSDIIRGIFWAWTESDGKYRGCRYWSKKAIDLFRKNQSDRGLIHEHIVPRKCLTKMLFSLSNPKARQVREILDKFLIAVVVTPGEDKKLGARFKASMPSEFEKCSDFRSRDPWSRYSCCGIERIDTHTLRPDDPIRSLGNRGRKKSRAERFVLDVDDAGARIVESGPQAQELDRRVTRLKETGSLGSSWTDVKKRLRKRRA